MLAAAAHIARLTGQVALAASAAVVVSLICSAALLFTLVCAPPKLRA
jgi:hypothetical protein